VVEAKKENIFFFNLSFYGLDLASRQKTRIPINLGGQFGSLRVDIVIIKFKNLMKFAP
jgi:hypothetical protein